MTDINCDGCGACCMLFYIPITVPVSADAQRWYEMHGVEVHKDRLIFHTSCKHLDLETRKCTIYPERPKVCSGAPVGGPSCLFCRLHMKGRGVKIDDIQKDKTSMP